MLEWLIKVFTAIWNNLPEFTPLIIGAGMIYIGRQQYKTNKDRLKMELFDRRYKLYEAMIELITTKPITKDNMRKYRVKAAPAIFVFGMDIQDALAKVGEIGIEIAEIVDEYPHVNFSQLKRDVNLSILYNNLSEAGTEATAIFAKYLTLKALEDKKKRTTKHQKTKKNQVKKNKEVPK